MLHYFNTNKVFPEKNSEDKDTFIEAVRLPLLFGQILCLVPIHKTFCWWSISILASIVAVVADVFMTAASIVWVYSNGISITKGGTIFFFASATLSMVLFIRLAYRWPQLMKQWTQVEASFMYLPNLKWKCLVITILILSFSTLEYMFELLYSMFTCYSGQEALSEYARKRFPQVFEIITYSPWHALMVLYINSVATLGNSFNDQLLILTTLALGDLFQSFTSKIILLQGKKANPNVWKILRSDFTKLYELTKTLDSCISHQVLITCALHLYVILVEMHNGLIMKVENKSERLYLLISFCVAIIRICAVCLSSVRVYEQSRIPIKVLYSVPPSSYCQEIKLFTLQVVKSEAYITGSGFFSLNRAFMLTVVGTLVTYEVLLIQLNEYTKEI